MLNKKVSSFTVRFFWPLMICLGLGLLTLVGLVSYRSDIHLASQNLTDATQYVKQQCTAYDRFNDTSVTKSLMRAIENAQQIDREIQYKIALTGEAALEPEDLRRYAPMGWTTLPCAGTLPRKPCWKRRSPPSRPTPPASGWRMAPTWTWPPTAAPMSRA